MLIRLARSLQGPRTACQPMSRRASEVGSVPANDESRCRKTRPEQQRRCSNLSGFGRETVYVFFDFLFEWRAGQSLFQRRNIKLIRNDEHPVVVAPDSKSHINVSYQIPKHDICVAFA